MPVKFADLPDLLTPHDLMQYLPVGRNAVYELLKTDRIHSVRIGQKYAIPKAAVRDFLGGQVE